MGRLKKTKKTEAETSQLITMSVFQDELEAWEDFAAKLYGSNRTQMIREAVAHHRINRMSAGEYKPKLGASRISLLEYAGKDEETRMLELLIMSGLSPEQAREKLEAFLAAKDELLARRAEGVNDVA